MALLPTLGAGGRIRTLLATGAGRCRRCRWRGGIYGHCRWAGRDLPLEDGEVVRVEVFQGKGYSGVRKDRLYLAGVYVGLCDLRYPRRRGNPIVISTPLPPQIYRATSRSIGQLSPS